MSFPLRPSVAETDEDLLKLQEAFHTKKCESSVKIKKTTGSEKRKQTSECAEQPTYPSSTKKEHDNEETNHSSIAGTSIPGWIAPPVKLENRDDVTEAKPPRKKSLFALRLMKARAEKKELADKACSEIPSSLEKKIGDHSYIITGKDADEIHQSNVDRLSRMSATEIEEERKHIMSHLDAKTISFLMSRRKNSKLSGNSADDQKKKSTDELKSVENITLPAKKTLSSALKVPKEPLKTSTEGMDETLPINPNETKQWLHMNVVEKEKLEWMKDLKPLKSSSDDPYPARFGFDGLLLPYNDESIDINKGLHHHGEEPERPGYTLQELMQLSRSSIQQQRVLGLTTLGNIFSKFKLGIYDKVLHENLMKELLDAGIFLLLRFSMDDNSSPVVFAAVAAMRNLLYNEPDEASLDFCLGCEGGLYHPILGVPYEGRDFKKIQEQREHETELKDFEIIQLDVLKGAERTNLIVRLGYILDVLKGPPGIVLDVLIRIARHSQDLAVALVRCGGLLKTVRDEFLTARPSSAQSGYGEPSAKALRLMRVLAAHSRAIANTLVDKFGVMEPVITFVSMSSPELPHIQSLVIGGFYLWQTLLSYGLASQAVIDLFPILMRQLHFHALLTSAVGEDASTAGHELAAALAGIVELSAHLLSEGQTPLEVRPIFQLGKMLTDCTVKWLTQLTASSADKPAWSSLKMVGAALSSLAAVAKCASKLNNADSRSILLKLESLTVEKILPFLKSHFLEYLLSQLGPCSFLLSKGEAGAKRDPPNLPSLGSIEWGGENVVPSIRPEAPHPLLSGLLRYLNATHDIFDVSTAKFEGTLLDNCSLEKYVLGLVTQRLRSSDNWFARQEVYMLCHLLSMVTLKPSTVPNSFQIKYCQLAFCLVDLIQTNDRHLISDLFSNAIFNPLFLSWGTAYFSPCCELPSFKEECLSNLAAIHSIYGDVLGTKCWRFSTPSQRVSITLQSRGMEPALPIDWHYTPILLLYGQYNAPNRERISDEDSISLVVSCLRFLMLVESVWPDAERPLSITARWCRLSLIFLSGSDLFLDANIKRLLKSNAATLLKRNSQINFNEKIPGLSSFNDMYGELLLQFSSVSYGDKLFGSFILVPLQQAQDPQLRRMVWGEYAAVLRSLSTPIEEVGISIENFLQPCETDTSLLNCYIEALGKGEVNERHCPLLYKVAIHHVATYVKTKLEDPFAKSLLKRVEQLGNQELKNLLLNYDLPVNDM